mmetsp:Transcript_25208/g.36113  ORF Transcript_25208/g.36113 Transcript_25208/m.36113 type:complete len:228 (+) Transcript_25208:6670-7353(+)
MREDQLSSGIWSNAMTELSSTSAETRSDLAAPEAKEFTRSTILGFEDMLRSKSHTSAEESFCFSTFELFSADASCSGRASSTDNKVSKKWSSDPGESPSAKTDARSIKGFWLELTFLGKTLLLGGSGFPANKNIISQPSVIPRSETVVCSGIIFKLEGDGISIDVDFPPVLPLIDNALIRSTGCLNCCDTFCLTERSVSRGWTCKRNFSLEGSLETGAGAASLCTAN